MSFQNAPTPELIRLINLKNGTTFRVTDLTLSNPRNINQDGTFDGGVWNGNAVAFNTAVKITANPSSGYSGHVIQLYNRLKLAQLNFIFQWAFSAFMPKSVHGVLDEIAYYTGMQLTTKDLLDTPITYDAAGSGVAQLTADAGSLGWVGSTTINFTKGGVLLKDAVANTVLDGIKYPADGAGTKIMGPIYGYGYDFTNYAKKWLGFINNAVLKEDQALDLASGINSVDVGQGKGKWVANDVATEFNVKGATVLYNGLNKSGGPSNPAYKYFMMVKLADTVVEPSGPLILHYNDPFDPNDF